MKRLLATVSTLALMTAPAFAGAKTSLQWGVDRTVTPWSLCAYDSANVCQPILTLSPTGGTVTIPGSSLAPGAAATNVGTLSGDLTGTLPSPTIAAGAVTGAKMSAGSAATNLGGGTALTGILVGNGTSAATAITPGLGVATALAGPINSPSGLPLTAPISAAMLVYYGFIGDGTSHTLSSITIFRGFNTTGWTLSQWQAVLPAATSLSNQADWLAVQSYINAATGPLAITFPPQASPVFDQPISVCSESISFFGAGGAGGGSSFPQGTLIQFLGGVNGIVHCNTPSTKIELHNIALQDASGANSDVGVLDHAAQYTLIDNVALVNFNGYGIHFDNPNGTSVGGPGGTTLRKVYITSNLASGSSTTSVGIQYDGANSFINHGEDVLVQGYYNCMIFHSTNNGGTAASGIEDLKFSKSGCGRVANGIAITADSSTYGPFDYAFDNMSMDATITLFTASSGNQIKLNGGNWTIDPPVGSWTNTSGIFDIGTNASNQTHGALFNNLFISAKSATPVTISSLFTFEAGDTDIQLSGNHISYAYLTATNGFYDISPSADYITERGTAWADPFTPTPPPSNAINYNSSTQTHVKMDSAGLQVPTISSCGTSPSLSSSSNNSEGTIVEGSGTPTSCTLNFTAPIRNLAPDCELFNTQGSVPTTMTVLNATTLSYTHSASSGTVHYRCRPY